MLVLWRITKDTVGMIYRGRDKRVPTRGEISMTTTETDLLGKPLTEQEQELLNIYEALKKMAARSDMPPCAASNVRKALMSI